MQSSELKKPIKATIHVNARLLKVKTRPGGRQSARVQKVKTKPGGRQSLRTLKVKTKAGGRKG